MAEEGGFAAYGPNLIEVFREPYGRQLLQLLLASRSLTSPSSNRPSSSW
jgi:hypothetical protein